MTGGVFVLCSGCEKRPPFYPRFGKGPKFGADIRHDLCRQGFKSQLDGSRDGLVRMRGPGMLPPKTKKKWGKK